MLLISAGLLVYDTIFFFRSPEVVVMRIMTVGFLLALISGSLFAQEIKVTGHIDQQLRLPGKSARMMSAAPSVKNITLLKIELSDAAKATIERRMRASLVAASELSVKSGILPASLQLGMANVPVLDQGMHGACVTFANTAAIDAAINKGDYISQLCSLLLGRYLENHAYHLSGWDGSWGGTVLNQLSVFGVINKTQQAAGGCAGLTEYPRTGNPPEGEMSLEGYHSMSQSLETQGVTWSVLLDPYQAALDKIDMDNMIVRVKGALNAGDRLTFGVLLPSIDKGLAGAVGTYHTTSDSWVLTPEIAEDMLEEIELPGHEMIITGYDDDAVALDDQGRVHRGLFTLRNSWSGYVGDQGNFYMSYDYFKALVIEIQQIRGPRA